MHKLMTTGCPQCTTDSNYIFIDFDFSYTLSFDDDKIDPANQNL